MRRVGLIVILFFSLNPVFSQVNFMGKPGYTLIPSARKIEGRESLNFSFSYLPIDYSINNFMGISAQELFYTVQLQPTNWLSVNFVLTRPIDVPRIGIGDRHLDLQFFILRQKKYGINLSAIISPLTNASFIEHNAIILGRSFQLSSAFSIDITSGYSLKQSFRKPFEDFNFDDLGYQWIDKSLFGNEFLYGFFYGMQLSYKNIIFFSSEYDSKYFNFSTSALVFKKLNINLALLDFREPTAFLSYRIFLDKSRIKAIKK